MFYNNILYYNKVFKKISLKKYVWSFCMGWLRPMRSRRRLPAEWGSVAGSPGRRAADSEAAILHSPLQPAEGDSEKL